MASITTPDAAKSRQIESMSQARCNQCWTCGSCDGECPINIATGRLRPRSLVRMATLGLTHELIRLPDIWYCLRCRTCTQVCPNEVKPVNVAEFARVEAVRRGIISHQTAIRYVNWLPHFQIARRQTLVACLEGRTKVFAVDTDRNTLREFRAARVPSPIHFRKASGNGFTDRQLQKKTAACFTCGECSSACPVSGGRGVFDPRELFRMINLGLIGELLRSPDIWMCLACGRCTEACPQGVDGKTAIADLQEMAAATGHVPPGWDRKRHIADRFVYRCMVAHIDRLLTSNGETVPFTCEIAVAC